MQIWEKSPIDPDVTCDFGNGYLVVNSLVQLKSVVRLALERPDAFVVLAILILIVGALAIVLTPTDIFPNSNFPVVSIVCNFKRQRPRM
jgi:hypothetical protein